jgi:hypothetical protein
MFIELILIGTSFLLIVILIAVRGLNFAYAKEGSQGLNFTDKKIMNFYYRLLKVYKRSTKSIYLFFKNLPHNTTTVLNRISLKLYKKTRNLVNGNKVNSEKGAVSVYLKRIESGEKTD